MVQDSYYNQQFTCAVIVSDDDSTMKSNLDHSCEGKAKEGKMIMDECPNSTKNKQKKDDGRIPLDSWNPAFLSSSISQRKL